MSLSPSPDDTPTPRHTLDRRQFLRLTGACAITLPAWQYRRVLGSNDRVRVGIIGFADRARQSLLPSFIQSAPGMNMELVAVSDIWRPRREQGLAWLVEQGNKTGASASSGKSARGARASNGVAAKPQAFVNNDALYAAKACDAVIIATADHQHARHAMEALEAGCDVYAEKPLANDLGDARALLAATQKSSRILQVGTQRRSAPLYQAAHELIRSGEFGPIVSCEMTWNLNQPGRWRRPDLVASVREEDTDWGRFLINRPRVPFDPRHFIEYRLFWPYSSGIPCQWMVHQIDTVHWFTGLPRPRSVVANGGIYQWRDGRTNADTMTAVFDYGPLDKPLGEGGFQVVYSSRTTNSAGGIKEIYYSNAGALNLDTGKVSPQGGLDNKAANALKLPPNLAAEIDLNTRLAQQSGPAATDANTGSDPMTLAHMANWMSCIRSRQQPNAPIKAGYDHSVALCMTIAAIRTGQRVSFDDAKQEIILG